MTENSLPPERILYLTTQLAFGGAESQLAALARQFKARGHGVFVVSMKEHLALHQELLAADIPVFSLGMRSAFSTPTGLYRLSVILEKVQPDILHCHLFHANFLGRLVRLVTNIPVVISTAHSIVINRSWWRLAYRLTDPLADLTTSVSAASTAEYRKKGVAAKGKMVFVPNGIDTEQFRPNRFQRERLRDELGVDNRFVWIAVGRFEPPKDYPTLLGAFSVFKKTAGAAALLLVGDGPLRNEMEGLARKLKMEESVRFLGVRRDIPELMNASDAYVMSSQWEGFPMVLLEAAASGLPIVTTRVGGNEEVVPPGIGILVPPKEPGQLAEAMEQVFSMTPDDRRRMGIAARDHVNKSFRLDSVVGRWSEIYRNLFKHSARDGDGSHVSSRKRLRYGPLQAP